MNLKNRKLLHVIVIILLVLLTLLTVYYFLKDHGSMGGLPDVNDLPKTKGTMVGKTVQTSFFSLSEEIDGVIPFYYLYDPSTGQDALIVIQLPKILFPSIEPVDNENWYLANSKVSLMTIFEPGWGGLSGLVSHLDSESFRLLVQHTAYISAEETGNLIHVTSPSASSFSPEEIIDIYADPLPESSASGIQVYLGQFCTTIPEDAQSHHWIPLENGGYVYIAGNLAPSESNPFSSSISALDAVAYRYDFQKYLLEFSSQ